MIRKMRAVDCEALAGSWDLGAVNADFDVVHRVALPGGFGNEVIEANRELLGDFPIETGEEPTWSAQGEVALLFGTPPCSGWSVMNTSKSANARGADSTIQQCTWDLVRYAARCFGTDGEPGPDFVSFECVQQAFTQGRDLLTGYLRLLRDRTGRDYDLTHVLMSGASVGAAQYRPRYFFVAHTAPFGVEVTSPRGAVTYEDAIGDLRGLQLKREAQLYSRRARTPFQRHHRRPDDRVDWHVQVAEPGRRETNLELVLRVLETVPWEPGRYLKQVVEEHRSRLPAELHKFERGWGGPIRVRPDELGRVVHGGGAGQFVHWAEDRFLTLRELARLMGYPDAWAFPESRNRWGVSMWLGKNAPVESTTWISRCIRDSLKGVPGRLRGVSDPDRPGEFVVNVTHAYKDPARIVAEVR